MNGAFRTRGRGRPFVRSGPLILLVALAPAAFFGCDHGESKARSQDGRKEEQVQRPPIEEVLRIHTPHLMSIPGVSGTGEGRLEGSPAVIVFVTRKSDALMRALPDSLEGYPVDVQEAGDVRPLSK